MPLSERIRLLVTRREPARPLAIARIGAAFAILLEAPTSAETLRNLAEPGVLRAPYLAWTPGVTGPIAGVLIGLWLVSGLALLVGWRTRLAGAVLTMTLASVLVLDRQLYSNHLYLMALVTGLLTVADSGAAVSLDARRRGTQAEVAGWPIWMLRFQVSVVYGFAALAKLNPDFLSGSVVASYARREGLLALPADWRSFEPMLVLSVLAIFAEGFLAVGLWSRRWRPAALVSGLGLHTYITVWLSPTYSLLVFSLLMLPIYLVFLDAVPGSRVVVWDDGCGFCAGWVRWFRRLDWLHALRFVPRSELAAAGLPVGEEAAARALQLVDLTRPARPRLRGGFAAVAGVAEVLPATFVWAPMLRLPPIAWAGERVYRRVAARRLCELPVAAAVAEPSATAPRSRNS